MKGIKINDSFISEEELKKAIPTLVGMPVTENFRQDKPPVGIVLDAELTDGGIEVKIKFFDIKKTPLGFTGTLGKNMRNVRYMSLGVCEMDDYSTIKKEK